MLKLSTAYYCQNRKLLCQFFAQAIYLLDKTNQWNLKFWPSRLLKENSINFFVLNWKPGIRFCWNFSDKIWNFGLLACSKEIHTFLGVWIGNQNSDCAETFHSPKMLCQFFAQVIYLLDRTNRRNLRFWPSCLLEETSLIFCRLNWKPQLRFCSKCPWPITCFSLKGTLVQPKTVVAFSS